NNDQIDEAVATVFLSPHSYTGEDVVELSCHGGSYITNKVLTTVLNNGAVLAQAGEFTKRAFLNGKIDLTQSEAVMDIISAKGRAAARSALSIKDGRLRSEIDEVKNILVENAAHLSAWADYPEEDIPEVSGRNLLESISSAEEKLQKLLKGYEIGRAIKEGVDTLIIGKPNVGKSTLMNLLSGCEKSIVTNIPGTTRDIIQETVVLGSAVLLLSDTAGLRDTDNPIEKIGVDLAKKRLKSCGLVLAVFDASMPLDENDHEMIELLGDVPSIAVINKSDLETVVDIEYIKRKVDNIVFVSAANGDGLEELTNAVGELLGTAQFDENAAVISTQRQRECAVAALESMKEAVQALEIGMTLDAVTVLLEEAIQSLLELTGERATEVVVHNVFSKFCVGK
ncbi:MAG: tRNA uridine-5-carboxymethylaminomethyl(34) synthesis GTPase MnmE, partial [Clostridia bacterium]|nr:tRNA uridine-5-carboxymethylaminomethyl(34) synthesis GTPase MnmE [Clostridia bacterium]